MIERCEYIDSKGKQCGAEACYLLYFSADHPFDFTRVCAEHEKEYKYFGGRLNLKTRELEGTK